MIVSGTLADIATEEQRADIARRIVGISREEAADLYPEEQPFPADLPLMNDPFSESKYRQPMAAAPKPFTSRIVQGRRARTTSQHALWASYQQAMAQASRECAANFLQSGVRVPSRLTRRAVDAITRKCLRCGLLKREKKPEDPADG